MPGFESAIAGLLRQQRWAEAVAACRVEHTRYPRDATLHRQLASALMALGERAGAITVLEALLAIEPPTPELRVAQGHALLDLRRDALGQEFFERALALQPQLEAAHIGRAQALARLGRAEGALADIDALWLEKPDCAALHGTRAQLLFALGRQSEAAEAADRGHAQDPGDPLPILVQGLVLLEQQDAAGALAAFDPALALNATLAATHHNRGRALAALNRSEEALVSYAAAGRFDPNNPVPWLRLGYLALQMNQYHRALDAFGAALDRQSDRPDALQGRAQCLAALGRAPEAIDAHTKLLAVAPDSDYTRGELFHAKMYCCDWRDFEAMRCDIAARVRRGERADVPGSFLTHSDSPADQLLCARTFAADFCRVEVAPLTRAVRPGARRIRVAYLSADFGAHATAYLAAGLFEVHDRSRFEIHGISFGPDDTSAMRARLERAFDHFADVRAMSDEQIAAFINQREIDIAVDVKGHTLGGRPRIFALRPAPVQVSFLAFPGTLGAEFMDYIVADRHVIPETERAHYAEQVIYLPGSYQVNDSARPVAMPTTRRAQGLPDAAVVFCCFNSCYKITPSVFEVWMQILAAVPRGVLWLLEGSATAVQNLQSEASRRGVDPGRLIFAPWTHYADHLARCALADLFLDTLPYNAHTTASDALWSAVPLITLPGRTFASRVAMSLLHAVGLDELCTASSTEYRDLAIRLAQEPATRSELRRRLATARQDSTLFDSRWYCRQLEAAFEEIVARHRRGEPPALVQLPEV